MRLTYSETGGAVLQLHDDADGPIRDSSFVTVAIPGAADERDALTLEFDGDGHLVSIEFYDHRRVLPSQLDKAWRARRL